MAQFPCPQCGGKMFIEKVHEGYEVPCPHCGDSFRVPRGAAGQTTPPAPPPAPRAGPSRPAPRTPADAPRESVAANQPADAPRVDAAPVPSALEVEPGGSDDLRAPQRTVASPRPGGTRPPPPPRLRSAAPIPRQKGTSGSDTTAFVLGIVGIVACPILGPFAWHLGHQARVNARRRRMEPDGLATAGWILGIIGTVMLVGYVGLFGLAFVAGASGM